MEGKTISLDGTSFLKNRFFALFGTATGSVVVMLLVLLADTFIVGRFVGAAGVAAINIVSPIIGVSSFFALIFGSGTGYVYSRLIGEFKKDEADRVFGQGLITVTVFTVIMFLAFTILRDPYLKFMGLSDEVLTETLHYWRFEKYVLLLYPINYLLTETVYMDGDEWISNLANAALIIGNVVLSFIFSSLLGSSGASLGSLIGTALCTLILALHLLRRSNTLRARWSFRGWVFRETVSLAITDATPYFCWSVLDLVLSKMVINLYSDAYLPVLTMVINILELTLVFDGIGEAMSPLAEVYMGEGNYAGEKELAKHGFRIAVIEGFLALETVFIFAPLFASLYGIAGTELIPEAVRAVRIFSLSMPFASLLFLFTSQYRLMRKIGLSVAITFCAQLLFTLLFACFLIGPFGLVGIWCSFLFAYSAAMLVFGAVLYFRFRKSHFPWLCPDDECDYLNCSFILSRQNVMAVCDAFSAYLKERKVPKAVIARINLLIEETGTLAFENNRMRESMAEYTVGIENDGVFLITRDTGEQSDMTKTDGDLEDIQRLVVKELMNHTGEKQYLTTVGFNRCYYKIAF